MSAVKENAAARIRTWEELLRDWTLNLGPFKELARLVLHTSDMTYRQGVPHEHQPQIPLSAQSLTQNEESDDNRKPCDSHDHGEPRRLGRSGRLALKA